MAGNWKMNLNHLEAHRPGAEARLHAQRRATSTPSRSRSCRRSPPSAPCRRWSTATSYRIALRRAGPLAARRRAPTPATSSGRCWPSSAAPTSSSGTASAAQHHDEDDALVNAKVKAAFRHELMPILCVGEGAGGPPGGPPRRAHPGAARRAALAGVRAEQARQVVVAYEPVWAIGTGEVATPEDAQEVCAAIRARLAELYSGDLADGVRILYGGSVQGRQRRRDHGPARRRRCARRRRQPRRRGVRRHLPLPATSAEQRRPPSPPAARVLTYPGTASAQPVRRTCTEKAEIVAWRSRSRSCSSSPAC